MKILKYGLGGLLALALITFLGQLVASETGEVVVLTSQGDAGPEETRLWVVEHEGLQYLRAGETSGWYLRLKTEPAVRLERAGQRADYRAETHESLAAEINRLMREKYGWRDVYIDWMMGGREDAVAVALLPAG